MCGDTVLLPQRSNMLHHGGRSGRCIRQNAPIIHKYNFKVESPAPPPVTGPASGHQMQQSPRMQATRDGNKDLVVCINASLRPECVFVLRERFFHKTLAADSFALEQSGRLLFTFVANSITRVFLGQGRAVGTATRAVVCRATAAAHRNNRKDN